MIPIIINNCNRLTYTKNLVEQLQHLGYEEIYILDNGSTYEPLLEWYKSNPHLNVERLENIGHLALYSSGVINKFKKYPWVVYTDSDIELNSKTPRGFIERMVEIGESLGYNKVGLALKIEDLPDTLYGRVVKRHEQQFWNEEIRPNIYRADVDTTFCVLRPSQRYGYKALRIGGDYTARHLPWYSDFQNLTDEEKYYIEHAAEWSSYKRFYETIKLNT